MKRAGGTPFVDILRDCQSRTDLSETWSRGTSLPNCRVYVSRFPPGRLFKIRNVVYATSRCEEREVLLQISSRRDIFVTISGASLERIRIKLDFCNNLPNEMNRDGLSIFHRHSSTQNFAPSRLIRSIKFDSAIRLCKVQQTEFSAMRKNSNIFCFLGS